VLNLVPRHDDVPGGGGEGTASSTGCFTPEERAPGTHWIGLRVCLYAVAKKKSLCSYRKSNAGRPARRLVTKPTEIYRLLEKPIVLPPKYKSQKSESCFCPKFSFKRTTVPVLPLTQHHAMKAYWVSGGTAPPIL